MLYKYNKGRVKKERKKRKKKKGRKYCIVGATAVVTCLFANDTVLLAESEGNLQRVVNEFYSVCKRRKLNPFNTGFERCTLT